MATWSPFATNAWAIARPMPRLPPVTSTDLLNAGPPVGFGPVRGTLSATDRYAESPPRWGGDLDDLDKLDHRLGAVISTSSITRDAARSPGMPLDHPGCRSSTAPSAGVRFLVLEAEAEFEAHLI